MRTLITQFLKLLDRLAQERGRARVVLVVLYALVVVGMLPRHNVQEVTYRLGQVWDRPNLVAPFNFPITKPEGDVEREQREAAQLVPPVFVRSRAADVPTAFANYLSDLENALGAKPEATQPPLRPAPTLEALQLLRNGAWPSWKARLAEVAAAAYSRPWLQLGEAGKPSGVWASVREQPSEERLMEWGQVHLAPNVMEMAQQRLSDQPTPLRDLALQLINQHLTPNYAYAPELTELERANARSNVSPYLGMVQKDEVIVAQQQMVSARVALMIDSLNTERNARLTEANQWFRLFGQFLLVAILSLLTLEFLRLNRPEVFFRNRQVFLLLVIHLFTLGINLLLLSISGEFISEYRLDFFLVLPLSMAGILVTVFFDDRIGFMSNVVVVLTCSLAVQNSFEFFLLHATAGSFAVYSLRVLRNRAQFFSMAGSLLAAYTLTYFGYFAFSRGGLAAFHPPNLGLVVLNIFFTLGTYPLIYLFERLFGNTSNLTFMELLDTDHPLLKQLAIKAPGTYQHSLQVANIAEEVAKKIGANPTLVHAGALFHDIGKMEQPEFFVENQQLGLNPHHDLPPELSAEIIIRHVDAGVRLARQYRLPQPIVDFILTHHGTSRVEYFYQSYLRRHPHAVPEIEDVFRYNGVKPTSKEQAILMIVDSVEAASRSLDDYSRESLEKLVEDIVNWKVNDEQLVNARITFRDLYKMKREIQRLLISVYHGRIKYPGAVPAAA